MENKHEGKRAKNFTESEKNVLMRIAKEFSAIVDNKKTDSKTVKIKKDTWEVITSRYNTCCQTGERNSKQLKALYDILRKNSRSITNKETGLDQYRRGEGLLAPQTDGLQEKIIGLNILRSQLDPLSYTSDSSDAEDALVINEDVSSSPIMNDHPTSDVNEESSSIIQEDPPQLSIQEEPQISIPQFEFKRKSTDNLIKRKLLKAKQDEEIHNLKVAILNKELQIKDKEFEAKVYEAEMRRKILELEFKIKNNELQNIQTKKQAREFTEEKFIPSFNPLSPV